MSKEDEKIRNFVIYKMYMTDKEIEEAAPFILLYLFVVGVVVLIWWLIAK